MKILGLLIAVALAPPPAFTQESAFAEYEIKAAYVFNFAKFVEWPGETAGSSKFLVCALAKDSLDPAFEEALRGKTVRGRQLDFRRVREKDDLSRCNILFVAASERSRIAQIVKQVDGQPVLTIGETDQFVEVGGMIRLLVTDRRIRFELNLDIIHRNRLQVSSKLVQLAMTKGSHE